MVSLLFMLVMSFGFAAVAFGYDLDDELVLDEYLVEDAELLNEYLAEGSELFAEDLAEDNELLAELETEAVEALSTSVGWTQRGNYWYYYENGRPITGWRWLGQNWYFFHRATGRMLTGWWTDGGHRYFLNPRSGQGHASYLPEGAMRFGWLYYRNNWFYLNAISGRNGFPQGVMRTGWVSVQGDFYFFNPPATSTAHRRELLPGAMRTGTVAIDGIRDAEGDFILHGQVSRFRPCGRVDATAVNSTMMHLSLWWQRSDGRETVIPFSHISVPPAWLPSVVRGMFYWNSTSVPIEFTNGTRYNNTVTVTETNRPYLGAAFLTRRLSPLTNESEIQRFAIELYARNIDAHVAGSSQFTRSNVAASVMSHELGHVLGIIDDPLQHNGYNGSVMSTRRNRHLVVGPTSNDVNFANFLNNR